MRYKLIQSKREIAEVKEILRRAKLCGEASGQPICEDKMDHRTTEPHFKITLAYSDHVIIDGVEWVLNPSVWPGGKPRFEKSEKASPPLVTYPGGNLRADGLFELGLSTSGHEPIPEKASIRLENYAGIFRVVARTSNLEGRTNVYILKHIDA